MARSEPFKVFRVKLAIIDRLSKRKNEELYHGSLTAYIETILDKYTEGILVEDRDVGDVHATRVRRKGNQDEQRKAS